MARLRTMEEYYIEREQQQPAEVRFRLAGIPEEFWDKSWDDYQDSAQVGDESLKDILEYYASEWTPETRESLVLLGDPGFGKTFGMALVAMDLIEKGCWVRWRSMQDLLQEKHDLIDLEAKAKRMDDWGEHEKAEMKLRWVERDCHALFLDDVGQEYRSASGWSDSEFNRLLRGRNSAGKLTFITSNLALPEWDRYSAAVMSFLMQLGEVCSLTDGKDHRRRQTELRQARRARR